MIKDVFKESRKHYICYKNEYKNFIKKKIYIYHHNSKIYIIYLFTYKSLVRIYQHHKVYKNY